MKIVQIMPTVSFGDAVSNDARAICKVVSEMGYKTGIYAENVDYRINDTKVHRIKKLPKLSNEDIVIFNHSTGTDLCSFLPNIPGRKMMIYHNITPPEFFSPYNTAAAQVTKKGYSGTKYLSDKIDYVMAVSDYNAQDLRKMGYVCPMFIRPILIPFEDYKKTPDASVINKYSDGYTNIVFVGRVAPNKKQEDLIRIFAYYKKNINPRSRLIIVGNDSGMEKYSACLKSYVEALGVEDVVFTGQISFKAILAYYKVADVFMCMSEHEGFCVPLVEAMFFDVPIIAYASSAIPDTLGGSGMLVDNKDPIFVSMLTDKLVNDKTFREHVIEKQRARLEYFSYENMRARLVEGLNKFLIN